MTKKTIQPARKISGAVQMPGDKSISHRYAILAALAEGRSEILNFSPADDCRRTLDCLRRLGIEVRSADDRVVIQGAGLEGLRRSRGKLDAGNSGTTMRMLAGVLAGQPFPSTLTGDASLRRRPMRRVIEPLAQMGAEIHARENEFAPLEIHPAAAGLRPIAYTMPMASAQVKLAVLLAGLFAEGVTSVTEPVRTRDHTEVALQEFGARVERRGATVAVHGRAKLRPPVEGQLVVPGDLSSAVFFLAAALVLPESNLLVHNVGLNPTRSTVLDFLASMGAPISLVNLQMRNGELVGDIAIRHAPLSGGVVSGPAVAQMIDELPMLAALAPYTEQGIEIRDAQELRVKESDRIAALAENLRRMGAAVEEGPEGLRVSGCGVAPASRRSVLRSAEIDPQGDHRIAMAFAVAALGAEGETRIREAECVAVSFPHFFDTLEPLLLR